MVNVYLTLLKIERSGLVIAHAGLPTLLVQPYDRRGLEVDPGHVSEVLAEHLGSGHEGCNQDEQQQGDGGHRPQLVHRFGAEIQKTQIHGHLPSPSGVSSLSA